MNAGRSEQLLAAAVAQHRAGRLAEAERLYRLLCDADPNNARAFHLLGVVAHQLNRSDAATLVGRAVMLDPAYAEAHNDRGVILAANGLFADAVSCFERAVALNPGYREARNNFGRGLRSLGRFDEALVQFEWVLKSTPDSPLAHFNLASVLQPAGRAPDAGAGRCGRCSSEASAASHTIMSGACTRRTRRWRCATRVTCTHAVSRASASGWFRLR